MKQLVPGVYLLAETKGANVFLIVSGKDLTLVDTGSAGNAETIKSQGSQSRCSPEIKPRPRNLSG